MRVLDGFRLFLSLNIWLCLTSVVMVGITAIALSAGLASVGVGLVLPALLTYVVYVHDRRVIKHEDWINQPHRTALVERYQRGLFRSEVVAFLSYQGILLFLVTSNPTAGIGYVALGQVPIGVLAVYDYLKRFPIVDSLVVGSTWAYVIVFTVLVSTGDSVSTEAAIAFASWTIIGVAGVESRNIRDLEGDVRVDKRTLPTYIGAKRTKVVERALKSVGVVLFWYISNVVVAGLVVGYLALLWLFRTLTTKYGTGDVSDASPVGPSAGSDD